ncbi:hypothetical protein SEMRO_2361_G324790.1 [Seminavis robusta]|uniref:Uncharacterized protein n=1 Tax=Seminavis robusta TaxID=568900 RepID=A0A9N8EXK8_9STRA|nr:hypothetical protein SEMRO_2361_G324790.1 [Seminavis robusta]|eukprot:Sro2361_g324790.1 n/a (176) ;mRNA; r:8152-8679
MPLFHANTFLFNPQQPTPLPLEAICQCIAMGLVDAVNNGAHASISVHVHPNYVVSNGDLAFLDGVEGTIVSKSMHHLVLVSDQGGCHVTVHFVGGGSLFAVAHAVDSEVDSEVDPQEDTEDDYGTADNEDDGGDEYNGDDSSSGSSTRMDPNNLNESNASSDFDGTYGGFSQLSI